MGATVAVVVVVVGGGHFSHDAVSAPQSSLAPHCGRQACSGAGAWLRRVRLGRLRRHRPRWQRRQAAQRPRLLAALRSPRLAARRRQLRRPRLRRQWRQGRSPHGTTMPRTFGGPRGTTSPCLGVPLSHPPRQLWRPPQSAGPGPSAMVGVATPVLWCLRGARHPRLLGRLLRGQRGATTSARACGVARHHRRLRTQRARRAQERGARSRNRKASSKRRTITRGNQAYSRRKVVRIGQQDAGGYGGHIHADVSLPSALTTTLGIPCTTPVFCARLYKMGIA